MSNKEDIKVKGRRYASHMIKLNEYLDVFMVSNLNKTIGETELNGILLHSMPSIWGKKDFIQGLDIEAFTFKKEI